MRSEAIRGVEAAAYRIPTDRPESDGTFAWDATTLVAVHVEARGHRGFGYSYTSAAAVPLVGELAHLLIGMDPLAVEAAWKRLVAEVRNIGLAGLAATAISAIDAALWDLKARILDLPLVRLLGQVRDQAPLYGSGGFTSYPTDILCEQLADWVEAGFSMVKMKVGRHPEEDPSRVSAARRAIGDRADLMVDANGAYRPAQALRLAEIFADAGVVWFEEPLSSDDLPGLRRVRDRAPPGLAIAAGEYNYRVHDFHRMLEAGAVDVIQADASRCLGITGFLSAARLCQAYGIPLSAHTSPTLHLHPACATTPLVHVEYFHDHARIESQLFEGFQAPHQGSMRPDLDRPGLGVELKIKDAERYRVA